jgi:CxxC motif-containing protein (DUF1111 family)
MSRAHVGKNGTLLALGLGALALAACSGETTRPHNPSATGAGAAGNGSPTGSGAAGDGVVIPPVTSGGAGSGVIPPFNPDTGAAGMGSVDQPPPYVPPEGPASPPTAMCGNQLPSSFTTICSGCHTSAGAANSRYPDLFKFMGDAAAMKTKVRMGGNGMAAYPASLIADADLDLIYTYFKGQMRKANTADLGGVTPLFATTDAVNPPIIFKRDDGAIITRGAGRVRGRHEGPLDTNMPFMEFVVNYFSDRTYGWIVEDYTPMGQSKITTTYLPRGPATGGTNFRAFKQYGNGDVFTTNGGLTQGVPMPQLMVGGADMAANYQTKFAPYFVTQQHTMTTNTRSGGEIKAGELFEFEFGLFFQGSIQPAGSRTSYYTDTFRYKIGQGGVTADNPDKYTGGKGILGPVLAAQSGGDTTNVWPYFMQDTQFGQMALNVQHENVQNLVEGRRLFHTNFADGTHSEVGNGVFTEQMGKAGPMGQQKACEGCHPGNGPGATISAGLDGSSMAIKLYNAGNLGIQLQPQEGQAMVMGTTPKTVMLADGTSVALSKPNIAVMATAGGTAPAFSARIARKVIGMGLLEAIDERTILARADMKDCDGNTVSGRPNFIKDPKTGVLRLGRFGWKAEKVSLAHQVQEAAMEDMGVGSALFPDNGKAELTDVEVNKLTTYMRLVSVPGQRNYGEATQVRGEQIFKTIGCANCHATDVVTGANHPFAELRNQAIKPYTDLLLHDMGADLADNSGIAAPTSESSPAAASEWRTPPLWGTGLLSTISKNTGLLHDGRAKNVLEAVLWHGGEAETTKQNVIKLPAADRDALIAFVNSL